MRRKEAGNLGDALREKTTVSPSVSTFQSDVVKFSWTDLLVGFVTFKTISEAHRIARSHRGKLKELFGAELHLAPMPQDIIWDNIAKDVGEVRSRRTFGFVLIGVVCFFNTLPVSSLLARIERGMR